MAQHPEKLRWKDEHPYGLSASQFGMALGFCGRVSDFVHYLRHIVGTEQEFRGNTFTAHGINTEPKSRALYELLTGCEVHDGGFFVTADRILGCSPDGQVYVPADEVPIEQRGPMHASLTSSFASRANSGGGSPLLAQQGLQRRSSGCSVRVPFKSKRRARSPASTGSMTRLTTASTSSAFSSPLTTASHSVLTRASTADAAPAAARGSHSLQKVRLLEIKSPFRALYDSTKSGYEPFGIPLHYMCQIQGQLAIADCEECDFFIYLDHPVCQVEAWRVRRSRAFWAWAEPHLRLVSSWVKDGPPDWLNRAFAFEPFNFKHIDVVPLVFPFDITARSPLLDARRFAFFARFPNPYEALERHREARGLPPPQFTADARQDQAVAAAVDGAPATQDWCVAYAGGMWADLTEYERVAVAVQTPIIRHLFEDNDSNGEGERGAAEEEEAAINPPRKSAVFCQTLSAWRRVLEAQQQYENSPTAQFWKTWISTAAAGRDDPVVELRVSLPEDWEEGMCEVHCTLPSLAAQSAPHGTPSSAGCHTTSLRFFQRLFFASVRPALRHDSASTTQTHGSASPVCTQPPYATPLGVVPVFSASSRPSSKPSTQGTPSRVRAKVELEVTDCVSLPLPPQSAAQPGQAALATESVQCTPPRPSEQQLRVVAGLSQHIRNSHAAQQHEVGAEHTKRLPGTTASLHLSCTKLDHEAAMPIFGVAAVPKNAPLCLRCDLLTQDLMDVIQYAEDCEGVLLLADAVSPPLYYRRRHCMANTTASRSGFTLLMCDGELLQQLLLHSNEEIRAKEASNAAVVHPGVRAACRRLMHRPTQLRPRSPEAVVPCFVNGNRDDDGLTLPAGMPCFMVQTETTTSSVLASAKELVGMWEQLQYPS